MSASARQKVAVGVAAALAIGLLGFVTARDRATQTPAIAPLGTVTAVPSKPVDVVDLTTPAQAAIAVSSRLFAAADLAVLTDGAPAAKRAAIATATRLKVPILIDDPAAPAELTRLRATRVLTFGTVADVVGAVPAADNAPARASQIAELRAGQPDAAPSAVDAVVLMKSTSTFDVAAATATNAGATVLTTTQGDLRKDTTTAAVLAKRPGAPVIALGAPFSGTSAYSVTAVTQQATQIGGGYFALVGRRFVGLHGIVDDPDSGVLGRQDLSASITLVNAVVDKFVANDSRPIVPMFEVVADAMSAAALKAVVDTAGKAGVYVLIDLRPGTSTFLEQAKPYQDLLSRKNVGLTLEPGDETVPASEINQVSAWLADLTGATGLPQKLFVVRETSSSSVSNRASVDTSRPELAVVLDVDMAGDPAVKLSAWSKARAGAPKGASYGWLQYTGLDTPMLTVNQTYQQIRPYPSVLTYQ